MKIFKTILALSCLLAVFSTCQKKPQTYPIIWVYISNGLNNDQQVEEIRDLLVTAAEHGYTGIYLSSGFDAIDLKPESWFVRIKQVKQLCDSLGLDLAPRTMDIGYNGALLSHNRNLAVGIPVKDALFVAKKGEAVHVSELKEGFTNKSFEKYGKGGFPGWEFAGPYGEVVFADKDVVVDGKTSVRFENFYDTEKDPGRLIKKVKVIPDRLYRLTLQVKTEGINESDPFGSGNFRVDVKGEGERQLTYYRPRVGQNTDWTEVVVGFNSRNYDEVEISTGMYGAESGRFWLDGMNLEEIGMSRLLRRDGTPLEVKGEKNGMVYEEGRDFEKVEDPARRPNFREDGPSIKLTGNSRIKPGERLRVSFYHGVTVYQGQVTACMSEPEVYEIWRRNAKLIKETIDPKYWFASIDEIRSGGTCMACRDRGMTMGEILGDCITRQHEIIHEVDPDAEIVIWSDMLDPHHNGGNRAGETYYHVDETFTGSWDHIPNDIIIACWWHKMRYESLGHFAKRGFRTIACGYYDTDDISNDTTWVEALDVTPGAMGIMYTTWLRKFELMDEFGDFVSNHPVPQEKPAL
ncbi:hypothetical protein ACFL4P_00575 [Gemmatimonadota bacterium]